MSHSFLKSIPLMIEVLSPVHCGTGNDYTPMDAVLTENGLGLIDEDMLLTSLEQSGEWQNFSDVASQEGIRGILSTRKFLHEFGTKHPEIFYQLVPVSQDLSKIYSKNISSLSNNQTDVINKLSIMRGAFTPLLSEPILPGSGVKGSIKTCFMEKAAKLREVTKEEIKNNEFISIIFGLSDRVSDSASEDPFRLIKFSDFELLGSIDGKCERKCIVVKNIKRFNAGNLERQGVEQYLEVIRPGVRFVGQITIHIDGFDHYNKWRNSEIAFDKLDFSLLKEACQAHYSKALDFEMKEFGTEVKQPGREGFLIKLGLHSGAFAVTLDGYRKIKNIKTGSNMNGQKTTWSAEDLPMGWCYVSPLTNEHYKESLRTIESRHSFFLEESRRKKEDKI